MRKEGPEEQWKGGAAAIRRPWLRACWIPILSVGFLPLARMSAAAPNDKPAAPRAPQAAAGDYVGAEVCATCHEEAAKSFANNPHSKLAEEHGKSGATCESCHGPGRAHVQSGGDKARIFNPAKAEPGEVDQRCLGCHAGKHANFERSAHAEAGVSCVSCHSVHSGSDAEHLLKAAQPALCYQCHADLKPQFAMPFHHKVDEGLLTCSDCHDPHGTFNGKQLKSTADQNAICTKCHAETRGPFIYEHAAIKGEGCLACHTPHGSANARLLNVPNINPLCNQCHSQVAAGTVHGVSAGSQELTPCISCHTMIHGSNLNQAFLK